MRIIDSALMRTIATFVLVAIGSAGSCEADKVDIVPPHVVAVSPVGPVVAVDASFEVTFSEPLATARILEGVDFFVLVPAAEVTDAFETDIRNPPLIESRQNELVPATLSFDESGTVATLAPTSSLRPGTAYALVVSADVRDTSGNPIVDVNGVKANFVYFINTDAGPPEVLFTTASGVLPPNTKRLHVTFNQPVQGVSSQSVSVVAEGAATSPTIESIEVSAARDEAVIILATPGSGSCERLTPSSDYRLQISAGIRDDEGRTMPAQSFDFSTGGACDLSENRFLGGDFIGLERGVLLLFATSKASTSEMWFGLPDGPLDCLGGPCPVVGAPARTESDSGYLHEIRLDDVLELGVTYAVEVRAEDDVGSVASARGTVITTVVADVAINEILPNPAGDEAAEEFIELVNFGDEGIPLAGYALQVGDKAPCTFGADAPVLAAGAFVVVARSDFIPGTYVGLDPSQVYNPDSVASCTSSTLTLSNAVQAVSLFDDRGRAVSVYPGYATLNPSDAHEGQSIERVAPDAPDVASSFCFGSGPPSPGRNNSAFVSGCDE